MITVQRMPGSRFHLAGIKPDNFLAFLALLGLLRALGRGCPEIEASVSWSSIPASCWLDLGQDADCESITAWTDDGLREIAAGMDFGCRKDLKFSRDEFRNVARKAAGDPDRGLLVAALSSDGAVQETGEEVIPTPLCLMLGQGHQHFLERLALVEREVELGSVQRARDSLLEALFQRWTYRDKTPSFRWDPWEDRRYALQGGDPSKAANKVGTVAGANRLAAAGFALMTVAPKGGDLAALATSGRRWRREFCWPLPAVPTSLAALLALLAHPWLLDRDEASKLLPYGVLAVARARRSPPRRFVKYFHVQRADIQYL